MKDKAIQSLRNAIPESDSLKAQAAHYIGIFEALPNPTLLLDATGTAIDVNEALVEFEHQTRSLESAGNRIGFSVLECINAPGGIEDLQALVDAMLKKGEVGEIEGEVGEISGHKATVVVRGRISAISESVKAGVCTSKLSPPSPVAASKDSLAKVSLIVGFSYLPGRAGRPGWSCRRGC